MSILGSMNRSKPYHNLLVEVLLNMDWTNRSPEVIAGFKKFIDDLMCMHSCYSLLIIDKLVFQFRMSKYCIKFLKFTFLTIQFSKKKIFKIFSADKDAKLWENGKCPESYSKRMSHIHELFRKFLKIIPM